MKNICIFFCINLNPVTLDLPALSSGILPLLKYKHWSLFIARLKPVEQLSLALSVLNDEPPSERKRSPPSHVWTLPLCQPASLEWICSSDTRLICPPQLSKTNTQYHKLFKEVSRDELLRKSRFPIQIVRQNVEKRITWAANVDVCVEGYTCALQRDILYQGKMFVSDNWICFHSKVFGRDTKVRSPTQLWLCCSRVWRVDVSKWPDFHPRVLCDLHQKNQNCAAGAERPRDRNGKLSGKRAAQVLSHFSGNNTEFYLNFLSFSTCLCPSCLETRPTSFWSLSVFIWRYFFNSLFSSELS